MRTPTSLAAAERLALLAVRVLFGAKRRDWFDAMASEAAHLRPGFERVGWIGGLLAAGLKLRCAGSLNGLNSHHAASAAMLMLLEWRSGAVVIVLPAVLLLTASLAYAFVTTPLALALLPGTALIVAHTIADFVPPIRPWYQYSPLSGADWVWMLVLLGSSTVGGSLLGRWACQAKTMPAR